MLSMVACNFFVQQVTPLTDIKDVVAADAVGMVNGSTLFNLFFEVRVKFTHFSVI